MRYRLTGGQIISWGLLILGVGLNRLAAAPEIMAVEELRPGMKGVGRTVFEGVKIEGFAVTIVGVLEKWDFASDLILVRIDSGPIVERELGILQGMSGTPIFVEGKLIGAVAYAWSFAKVPIAGVTPIAEMLEAYSPQDFPRVRTGETRSRGGATGRLRVAGGPLRIEGQLIREAVVAPNLEEAAHLHAPGTMVLTPVATPLMVTGLGRVGMRYLEKLLEPYNVVPIAAGGFADPPPDAQPVLEPGAAVGVQLARGDVEMTAIGTLTYLDEDLVLAFGHPFMGLGEVEFPLTSAYVLGVLPSLSFSFKFAAPLEEIGRVIQDRLTCVGGHLGEKAPMVPANFAVVDRERGLERDYRMEVIRHRDFTAGLMYSLLSGAIDSVVPSNPEGITRMRLWVKPKGLPPIERENLFPAKAGGGFFIFLGGSSPVGELAQILETLSDNPFREVEVEEVKAAVELLPERRTATVERAFADREKVKPGDTIQLSVYLKPYNEPEVLRQITLTVPENTPEGRLTIGLIGGQSAAYLKRRLGKVDPKPTSLEQMLALIQARERNNQLLVEMVRPTVGLEIEGHQLPDLPVPFSQVLRASHTGHVRLIRDVVEQALDLDWIVSGAALLTLKVETKEKDKVKPPTVRPEGAPRQEGVAERAMVILGAAGESPPLRPPLATAPPVVHYWPAEVGEQEQREEPERKKEEAPREEEKEGTPEKEPSPPPDVTDELKPEEPPEMPTWEEVEKLDFTPPQLPEEALEERKKKKAKSKPLARPPKTWVQTSKEDFATGEFEGTYLSGQGEVVLAPAVEPLAQPPCARAWQQAVDAAGNVYVGSWAEGKLFRIAPNGETTEVFDGDEVGVHAVAIHEDTVYFAGIPSGTVYRLAEGEVSKLVTLPVLYVWALAAGHTGQLYAGTGPEGRVYRISPQGEFEEVFQAPDRHVLALTVGPDNCVYLGTYPKGKVYRLDPAAGARSLFEMPQTAVLSIAVDRQGNVYAGGTPKGRVYKITPQGMAKRVLEVKEKHIYALLADAAGNVYVGTGEEGKVYRLAPDETVSLLYEPEEPYVLHLARRGEGPLFATTAGSGRVLRLNLDGGRQGTYLSPVHDAGTVARWGLLRWERAPVPGTQITFQTRTGNTALPDEGWSDWSPPYAADYGSPIASPPGRYIQYRANFYASGQGPAILRRVQVFYRTFNQPPKLTFKEPKTGQALAGKVTLRWSAEDPDKDTLTYEVFYSPDDGVTWTKIGEKGREEKAAEQPSKQKEEQPAKQQEKKEEPSSPRPTPEGPAESAVQWAAGEGKGGQVVAVAEGKGEAPKEEKAEKAPPGRAEAAKEEKPVPEKEKPLTKASLEWDTTKVPDGHYRLKVVASDRTSNPDDPQSVEVITEPFAVDNTEPVILLFPERVQTAIKKAQGQPVRLRITLNDATTHLTSAEYRFQLTLKRPEKETTITRDWTALIAADGIFDSPYEDVTLDLGTIESAEYALELELRARDAAENEAHAVVKLDTRRQETE
ncbi:MAG TPA: hypothetical protein EYP85_13550 [Armatimonadetes bacterium]|nr:hypothetical protein [Armatimonadota bacterium]